jgi:hypothetical protein
MLLGEIYNISWEYITLSASAASCVGWNRTGGPHQLESNWRPASAGIEPEARISWNRTGGPHQLESNQRLVSIEWEHPPSARRLRMRS